MSFGEQFLCYPDLFPARRAGEPWGEEAALIDVAGGPYHFTGMSSSQAAAVAERYAEFVVEETSGDAVRATVFAADSSDFTEFDLRGWNYSLDAEHRNHAVNYAGLQLMGRIDFDPVFTGALWTCEDASPDFLGPFENFFRPLVAYRLASRGALLLHSSGVVVDGGGILFVGPSTAGKSTVAKRAIERGLDILSDDLNVVMPAGEGWIVTGMPFAGDHRAPRRVDAVPLRSIFRLRKGATNAVEEMPAASAFAALFGCSPYVNVDPFRSGTVEQTIEKLLENTPMKTLRFTLDTRFWHLLEKS